MSARAKLPAHGTAARYRLELKNKRDGKSKSGACDRCRSAESERRSNRRASATSRPSLSIVGDGQTERTSEADNPTPADTKTATTEKRHPSQRRRKAKGVMETAVETDIAAIDPSLRVPFHESLSVLALELAREIDEPATVATARRDARKQLFEVLRSLRTTKEGDGNSAVDAILDAAQFGLPLVPGRPS